MKLFTLNRYISMAFPRLWPFWHQPCPGLAVQYKASKFIMNEFFMLNNNLKTPAVLAYSNANTRRFHMSALPAPIQEVLAAFSPLFTQPVWAHAQPLILGGILARGKRTIILV
ncbi:MAG: hypothetical protein AUK55_06125 [Syntrophobacteraceae bacterium CG2_30_61_12]|nr:MAG: hypothetical protein AUK55_06125 [Syntrophobacteraceae bacterium CG2_30_61_12]